MDRHQRVVLQQRVRALTVEWRTGDGAERVGGAHQQEEEERRDREQGEHREAEQAVVEPLPEHHRGEEHVAGEHQHPQHERALERGPERGDLEQQRQIDVAVGLDVLEREVVAQQGDLEDQRGDDGGAEHERRPAERELQQRTFTTDETDRQRDAGHHTADEAGEDGDRSEGAHSSRPTSSAVMSQPSRKSSGMFVVTRSSLSAEYSLVCLMSIRSETKT